MTSSLTRRRLFAATAAALVVLVLTGCSRISGSAAVVGEHRVEVADVQHSYEVMQAIAQSSGSSSSQEAALYYLLIAPTVSDAAESAGVAVSDQEARTAVEQALDRAQVSHEVLEGREAVVAMAVSQLEFFALVELAQNGKKAPLADMLTEIAGLDAEVNPRYGAFDMSSVPESGGPSITEEPMPWTVQPAAG